MTIIPQRSDRAMPASNAARRPATAVRPRPGPGGRAGDDLTGMMPLLAIGLAGLALIVGLVAAGVVAFPL